MEDPEPELHGVGQRRVVAHPAACGDTLLGVRNDAQHRLLTSLRREFRALRGGIRHGRRQRRRVHSRAAGAAERRRF
eukprot:5034353-Alexandrium_andersonii.AAC.1